MKSLTLAIKKTQEDTKALITCGSRGQQVSTQRREGRLQLSSKAESITEGPGMLSDTLGITTRNNTF